MSHYLLHSIENWWDVNINGLTTYPRSAKTSYIAKSWQAFCLFYMAKETLETIANLLNTNAFYLETRIQQCRCDLENDYLPAHLFIRYFDKLYTKDLRDKKLLKSVTYQA